MWLQIPVSYGDAYLFPVSLPHTRVGPWAIGLCVELTDPAPLSVSMDISASSPGFISEGLSCSSSQLRLLQPNLSFQGPLHE